MARKHIVVCQNCGRQFDASKGGYYNNQTRRYTCKKCGKQITGDAREKATGMRQSVGAMIAKIAIGALFVISGFTAMAKQESAGDAIGTLLVGLIIGAALITWGLVPYLKAKKTSEAAAARDAAAAFELKNAPKKCSACGAMTKGDVCEYCGAPLK